MLEDVDEYQPRLLHSASSTRSRAALHRRRVKARGGVSSSAPCLKLDMDTSSSWASRSTRIPPTPEGWDERWFLAPSDENRAKHKYHREYFKEDVGRGEHWSPSRLSPKAEEFVKNKQRVNSYLRTIKVPKLRDPGLLCTGRLHVSTVEMRGLLRKGFAAWFAFVLQLKTVEQQNHDRIQNLFKRMKNVKMKEIRRLFDCWRGYADKEIATRQSMRMHVAKTEEERRVKALELQIEKAMEFKRQPGLQHIHKTLESYGVTDTDIARLKTIFDEIDENQTGALDEFAFTRFLQQAVDPGGVTAVSFPRLWFTIDANGDGLVQFHEFVLWWRVYYRSIIKHCSAERLGNRLLGKIQQADIKIKSAKRFTSMFKSPGFSEVATPGSDARDFAAFLETQENRILHKRQSQQAQTSAPLSPQKQSETKQAPKQAPKLGGNKLKAAMAMTTVRQARKKAPIAEEQPAQQAQASESEVTSPNQGKVEEKLRYRSILRNMASDDPSPVLRSK